MTMTSTMKFFVALVTGGVCTTLAATSADAALRRRAEMIYWVVATVIVIMWEGIHRYNNGSFSSQLIPFSLALIFGGVMTSLAAKEEDASKRQPYLIAYWVVAAVTAIAMWYFFRKRNSIPNLDDAIDQYMGTDEYIQNQELRKKVFKLLKDAKDIPDPDYAMKWTRYLNDAINNAVESGAMTLDELKPVFKKYKIKY